MTTARLRETGIFLLYVKGKFEPSASMATANCFTVRFGRDGRSKLLKIVIPYSVFKLFTGLAEAVRKHCSATSKNDMAATSTSAMI